jgi:hypothetical protein
VLLGNETSINDSTASAVIEADGKFVPPELKALN